MSTNQTTLCRYKICLTAEDDTDTAEFIFFGRMAQCLIKKMWTPEREMCPWAISKYFGDLVFNTSA
jgi:hypothetical protein